MRPVYLSKRQTDYREKRLIDMAESYDQVENRRDLYRGCAQAYHNWNSSVDTGIDVQNNISAELINQHDLNEKRVALYYYMYEDGPISDEERDSLKREDDNAAEGIALSEFLVETQAVVCPEWIWKMWTVVRNTNNEVSQHRDSAAVLPPSQYALHAPILLTRSLQSSDAMAIGEFGYVKANTILGPGVSIPNEYYDKFNHVYRFRWDNDRCTMYAEILGKRQEYCIFGGISTQVVRDSKGNLVP